MHVIKFGRHEASSQFKIPSILIVASCVLFRYSRGYNGTKGKYSLAHNVAFIRQCRVILAIRSTEARVTNITWTSKHGRERYSRVQRRMPPWSLFINHTRKHSSRHWCLQEKQASSGQASMTGSRKERIHGQTAAVLNTPPGGQTSQQERKKTVSQ